MNFLGTFFAVLIILGAVFLLLASILQNAVIPLFIMVIAIIALAVCLYQDLDQRLAAIERHLGLRQVDAATLSEQLQNEETAP